MRACVRWLLNYSLDIICIPGPTSGCDGITDKIPHSNEIICQDYSTPRTGKHIGKNIQRGDMMTTGSCAENLRFLVFSEHDEHF